MSLTWKNCGYNKTEPPVIVHARRRKENFNERTGSSCHLVNMAYRRWTVPMGFFEKQIYILSFPHLKAEKFARCEIFTATPFRVFMQNIFAVFDII